MHGMRPLLLDAQNALICTRHDEPQLAGGADVLLVENDTVVRGCIAEMLDDAGLRVAEAETASEALAFVRVSGPPALLVTDLRLGAGMDGLALIAALRDRSPALRTILISGGELADGALDLCDAFLRKPFRAADLLRAVHVLAAMADAPRPS
jgi:CheY-like chemotaxis protein